MAITTSLVRKVRPEELVLQILERGGGTELRLPELISALGDQEIADSVIKTAVWELVAHRVIELTSERRLRVLHAVVARTATA
jgi:hypothetical protein